MSRFGTKPNTGYTKLPIRKIVERWTEYDPDWPQCPTAMITLECGHMDFDRGQKKTIRCHQCGPKE